MKKLTNLSRAIVAIAIMLIAGLPSHAYDYDFIVDGIYYDIISSSDKTVAVTNRFGGEFTSIVSYIDIDNVVIPETVIYSDTTYSVTTIGGNAFRYSTSLTSVTIPNSVTSIGDDAFNGCTGLTSITIPNSVTTIGSQAFYNCFRLTSVTIGNSVTTIGYWAFDGCTGLTSIVVTSGNSKYDSRTNCNAIIETATNTLILGCNNTIIPNSITSIGGSAFKGCTGLTSITIPNSVTSIGDGAFYGCSGLTEVTIGNSVTSIGDYAFKGCTGLTSVTIPNSVTDIGDYAFSGCTGLTSVTIPNSVTDIGVYAFSGCTGLTSVTIPNSVTSIGGGAFYRCTGLTYIASNCDTPPTIEPNSFSNYNATLYIPFGTLESYQSAEYWSNFSNIVEAGLVDGLRYLYISDTEVKVIGVTESVNKIVIPSTITINNDNYIVTEIADSAFINSSDLTSITIPNTVTTIGDRVFYGCSGLTSVTIPNSVTDIGDYAFYRCTGLTSVTIPNSVTTIGDRVFYGCTGLTSVTIPNSVTTIGSSAFEGCIGLTSVTIPNSVTTIGDRVFYGCTGLTSVTIPNSVTTIGDRAFYGCTGLTEVTIGNSVTSIGDYAFYGCTGLTSVTIPNSVTDIGDYAFYRCTGLTSVTIPNSVTTIGDYAFYRCTGLTSVTIPNSVTSIGDYVFSGCTGLAEVTIGNSVTTISNSAFSGCTGLTTVNFNATNCTTMGSSSYPVFNGCIALATLNIGNNVTNIPEYAFSGCTGLTTVNFNATNCTTMGSSSNTVFNNCTALATLNIGDNVTNIPTYAFYNCSSLTSVTGGDGLSTIGSLTFWGCDKLINADVTTTQTTVSINLTSPTQYNLGLYYNDSDKLQAENGVVTFTGLKPNYTNSNYDLALIINGIYCPIKDFSFTTQSFSAYLSGSTTVTSISATGTYTDGDVTILGEGINYGSSVTDYDGNNTITLNNLDPGKSYKIYYSVNTQEGGVYSTSKSFTTAALTWSNGGFTATSTTSARLSVETSCDATAGTGFEWKRYDAPESLAPSKAPCSVVDGMLVGSLRNLNPDVYYTCRPYYTSSSGNTYYGEWITFFTGDANVYFEPEVRTFSERSVVNNSVTVRGYALPGTDDISEQGFEYWKVPASRATATVMTVKASGISMTATLADLEYNSTYRYRAYVKTAQGTFYGAEEEFSTGEDPAGIEYIEVDDSNGFDVTLRENPATATAWIKVAGTSAVEIEYYILTTNGGVVAHGIIPADGDYQPIELNIAPGLYLMSVTDGSHRKTLRLIVR